MEMPNGDVTNGVHAELNGSELQNSKTSNESSTVDKGQAVDYIKNKYETTKQPTTHLPASFREPKKLDVNWDKVVVEERKPIASSIGVTDLLSCLNVQVNDCKAAFEGGYIDNSSDPSSPLPVNRQVVEKVAPPEITKSVRALFESGQVNRPQGRKAPIVLDVSEDAGVYENDPTPCQVEGLVRSADFVETNHVQKGATKDLLNQWNQKGMQDFKADRRPINIREDDGKVLENEPVRRTDVVNCAADYVKDGAEVQKGTTRSLLDQWKVKGNEEFVPQRKAINIAEDDGKVIENTPTVRTDVERGYYVPEGTEVQKGTTRSLLDQWKVKGNEEFKSDRKPITIAEDEGKVLENEPTKRTDVVNANYTADMDVPQVEKGMAKNLLNQWKTKGTEEFKSDRKPINIAEDDGRVLENEPIKRTDVVNADYTADMDAPKIEKGMAKNLMNQWKTKGTEEFKVERKPINIAEDEGRILENEPVKRTDVVNAVQSLPEGPEVQSGTTRNLLDQWKTKGTEEFKVDRKPVNLAEDQGQITENEPQPRRTDVVNANEALVPEGSEVQKGTTRSLLHQWNEKQNQEFKVDRKPINIAEDDGKVLENEPVKRTDVVNAEYTHVPEGSEVQKGTTKNLLDQWKVKGSEEYKAQRRTIVIAEDDGHVIENQPLPQRDDVVRQVYEENQAELPGKGVAKNLLNQWSNVKEAQLERKPINLIEGDQSAPYILENDPVVRTDVLREEDNTEELWLKKGYTKNLAGFWTAPQTEFKSENKAIDLCEGADANAPAVYENNPEALVGDVVRSADYKEDEVVSQHGMIKNIREKFREDIEAKEAAHRKPREMIQIDREQEGGVYENTPEAPPPNVLRGEYQAEEKISVQASRSMRELWNKKEKQEEVAPRSTPQPVRFTPPRELTPPPSEDFKSTHTITLSPNASAESNLPAYMTSPLHNLGSPFPKSDETNQDPYQQYANGYQ